MTFIQPLELQTWLISIFAGKPEIFAAIALLVITSMAAYFRMKFVGLIFILGIFLIMFSGFIDSFLIILIVLIGGLVIGYVVSRLTGR
ncbi:MAG TPA: hypothetical protein ENG87_01745 [Candidatus Pacearchaeota archaeon]|nr:hypothetical protein [Candidatus Pacearchaeota archaeon]